MAEPAPFLQAQDAWSERLISEEKFCDTVAVLGPEGERFPFVRALLANLSDPLNAALYGSFQEAKSKELVLKEVTPEAFRVLLRAAVHLDPQLSPESTVHALKVSKMYLIEDLEKHCLRYLKASILPEQVLEVLTAAAKIEYVLPSDVQKQYWSMILVNSAKIVEAPSFIAAHGSIIARVVQMDEFDVKEERLWSRLVEWAERAVEETLLLGPFADAIDAPAAKRPRGEEGPKSEHSRQQQMAVLQCLTKHIRFASMTKEFFADRARPYLKREDCEAVMMYFLLGRIPPQQLTSRRSGLSPVEQIYPIEVTSVGMPEGTEHLAVGRGSWKLPFSQPAANRTLSVQLLQPINVTKVTLSFGEGAMWSWKIKFANSEIVNAIHGSGRIRTMSVNFTQCTQLTILPISERDRLASVNNGFPLSGEHAVLVKVEVTGKKSRAEHAAEVVQRLSQDLVAPAPNEVSGEFKEGATA